MTYPESKAADEHFENLRQQYADTITRARNLCDEATDSADFIKASEEAMKKHTVLCEDAIAKNNPQKMVDNTSAIARLANRVILVAKQESDNSEDRAFIDRVNQAADYLQSCKIFCLFTVWIFDKGPRLFLWKFFLYLLIFNSGFNNTFLHKIKIVILFSFLKKFLMFSSRFSYIIYEFSSN